MVHGCLEQRVAAVKGKVRLIYYKGDRYHGANRKSAVVNACNFLEGVRERDANRMVAPLNACSYCFRCQSVQNSMLPRSMPVCIYPEGVRDHAFYNGARLFRTACCRN